MAGEPVSQGRDFERLDAERVGAKESRVTRELSAPGVPDAIKR
jgi:hypothetical protein